VTRQHTPDAITKSELRPTGRSRACLSRANPLSRGGEGILINLRGEGLEGEVSCHDPGSDIGTGQLEGSPGADNLANGLGLREAGPPALGLCELAVSEHSIEGLGYPLHQLYIRAVARPR
jgi:hypothetical protein